MKITPIEFDHDTPNESRADYGARIQFCTPDWGANELYTDVIDALADVVHYLHRCGFDPRLAFSDALESAAGDLEDGPEAVSRPYLDEAHGR